MAASIKSLLNKKGWTGAEVGKLLIENTFRELKTQQPFFTQEEFDAILGKVTSTTEREVFSLYSTLCTSLLNSYNFQVQCVQRFYHGFYWLVMMLEHCAEYEKKLKDFVKHPYIVSDEEYQELKERASNISRQHKESFCSLFFHILDGCLDEDAPIDMVMEVLNPIKGLPAKENRYAASYYEVMGEGYHQLDDGRRSDEIPKEEWKKIIISNEPSFYYERQIKTAELHFKGASFIRDFIKEHTGKTVRAKDTVLEDVALKVMEDTTHQTKEKELVDLLDDALDKALGSKSPHTTWHYYEGIPEDLVNEDILSFYREDVLSVDTEAEEKKILRNFKKDFPELFDIIKTAIEIALPSAVGMPASDYGKHIFTWGELAEAGLGNFKSLLEASKGSITSLFDDDTTMKGYIIREKITMGGIAVLKEKGAFDADNTPEGLFTPTILKENIEQKSLYYWKDSLISSIKYVYATNAFFEVASKVYDLPEMPELKYPMESIETQMKGYNNLIFSQYKIMEGTPEEKARKRKKMKQVFHPVDIETLKPSAEAIATVEKELRNLGYSRDARIKLNMIDAFIGKLEAKGGE